MNALTAMLIEDSVPLGTVYREMLRKMGFQTTWFESGRQGLDAILATPPDLLLLDLELPDLNGDEILQALKDKGVQLPIIVITAHGSVEAAVGAMRLGATDFLEKPFQAERLKITVDNALTQRRLRDEMRLIREQIERDGYAGFVGRSLPMQVVYRIIDSAAASRASVFITGESGTGKELCAQAIHQRSDRAEGPFIPINCGAIPRDLFESEIFGHIKGAFSGATADRAGAAEQADGGTLFLDEIGEMDLDLQVKLLRFIQTGTFQRVGDNRTRQVNVRFVCATNRDPHELVGDGRFREDLFYRLNVIPIKLPPLRERDDDVLQIASTLLGRFSDAEGRDFECFSTQVEYIFRNYDWPGNVRQLSNVIHNIVLLNKGTTVTYDMLPAPFGGDEDMMSRTQPIPDDLLSLPPPRPTGEDRLEPLWLIEKRAIENAIAKCDGNVPVAAAHLGVSASTLYRKKKAWDAESA